MPNAHWIKYAGIVKTPKIIKPNSISSGFL
jgi:hypothetical protein